MYEEEDYLYLSQNIEAPCGILIHALKGRSVCVHQVEKGTYVVGLSDRGGYRYLRVGEKQLTKEKPV